MGDKIDELGQIKVMLECCYATENLDRHMHTTHGCALSCWKIAGIHLWYEIRLQDLVHVPDSHQCTSHMYKAYPTILVDSCPHKVTYKMIDVVKKFHITVYRREQKRGAWTHLKRMFFHYTSWSYQQLKRNSLPFSNMDFH